MKFLYPLLFLSILSACAHRKPTVERDYYLQLHKTNAPRHKACREQNKEVFEKAITETLDAELDDENYFFVRSEQKAVAFMKKVDLTKLTLRENQQEYHALIKGCGMKQDPTHKPCDTMEPPMKFYRGLIYALRQYNWSEATEDLAFRSILQYIRHVAESKSTLINLSIANDLLTRLGNFGYVPETVRVDSMDFRHELEATQNSLNERVMEFSKKKKLECSEVIQIMEAEKQTIDHVSERFLMMLRQTK